MLPEVPMEEDARSTKQTQQNATRSEEPLLPLETRVLGGRYRIRRLLGRGGMANVFLGDDLLLERAVAIKIMHTQLAHDSSGMERFRREAMTLAAVCSPHVVSIYDIGLDGGGVFIVMQHVDGSTLEEDIARIGPMATGRAATVLMQLLDGLSEVHALGLVHRDIKPSNVILDATDHVVLLDLGIAFDPRRAPLTAPGMVAGTPGYLAPESHGHGTGDYASDVYQVGLLMLFLLTGVDVARRGPMKGVEDLLEQLSPPFRGIARRALAADRSERYPSAAMMRTALTTALGSPIATPSKHVRPRTTPLHRPASLDDTAPAIATAQPSRSRNMKATVRLATQPRSLPPVPDAPSIDLEASRPTRIRISVVTPKELLRGKVMIVDDDIAFARTLCRMLKSHDVLAVDTPSQVVAHIEGGARADVLLCGLATPMRFHAAVLEACPAQAAAIIFLTETDAAKETRLFVSGLKNKRLGKPFDLDLLKRMIVQTLVSDVRLRA